MAEITRFVQEFLSLSGPHQTEPVPIIKVKGEWRYLYRAVDKHGQTIDFLLTKERDEQAAKRALITASATSSHSE
jgi:hypothetical protein